MKDLLLDLITSYESRVVVVESLVINNYDSTDSGTAVSEVVETNEKLKDTLRETLVRNCSLRRKDFDALAAGIFSDIDSRKASIDEDRKAVRLRLESYLKRQKQLIVSLKEKLVTYSDDESKRAVESVLDEISKSQKEEGTQSFTMLTDFQVRLKNFRQELEVLNHELQRILERGELLRLEDLRKLQASFAIERRKDESRHRSDDVQRLLASFNRERHATNKRQLPAGIQN
jgi:hypothetical protein